MTRELLVFITSKQSHVILDEDEWSDHEWEKAKPLLKALPTLIDMSSGVCISKYLVCNHTERQLWNMATIWANKVLCNTNYTLSITGSGKRNQWATHWHTDSNVMTAVMSILGPGTQYEQDGTVHECGVFKTLLFKGQKSCGPALLHRASSEGPRLIFQARTF